MQTPALSTSNVKTFVSVGPPKFPLFGEAQIFDGGAPLALAVCQGDVIRVVRIRAMDHFPLDASILPWCPNSDMVYYWPTEGIEDDHDVDGLVELFPFREFKKIVG